MERDRDAAKPTILDRNACYALPDTLTENPGNDSPSAVVMTKYTVRRSRCGYVLDGISRQLKGGAKTQDSWPCWGVGSVL